MVYVDIYCILFISMKLFLFLLLLIPIFSFANGDPMAIIQGRIGLIGCHPESEQFWYDSYSWMRPHWHQGQHHRLLLEFVNNLMEE